MVAEVDSPTSCLIPFPTALPGCALGAVDRSPLCQLAGVNAPGAPTQAEYEAAFEPEMRVSTPHRLTGGVNAQGHFRPGHSKAVPVNFIHQREINLGWLAGSVGEDKREVLLAMMGRRFGAMETQDRGFCGRTSSVRFALGPIVAFDESEKMTPSAQRRGMERPFVEITGSVLEGMEWDQVWALSRELDAMGFKANRVDSSWDDYKKRVMPFQVALAVMAFDVAQFMPHTMHFHFGGLWNQQWGETLYLGTPGADSGALLRAYRKDVETEGKIDAVRWEIQYRGEKSQMAWKALMSANNAAGLRAGLASLVSGSVDFPIRAGTTRGGNLDRLQRHTWWVEIQAALEEPQRVTAPPKPAPTIEKKREYFRDFVSGTLKAIEMTFEAVDKGIGRVQAHQWLRKVVDEAVLSKGNKRAVAEWCKMFGVSVPDLDGGGRRCGGRFEAMAAEGSSNGLGVLKSFLGELMKSQHDLAFAVPSS